MPLAESNNIDALLAVSALPIPAVVFRFIISLLKLSLTKLLPKKKNVFLFSERLGFQAVYDKKIYPVKPLDFLKNGNSLPAVTKLLLQNFYLSDGKKNPPPSVGRG